MYEQLWKELEDTKEIPHRFNRLHIMPWYWIKAEILNGMAHNIINNLYKGDAYLIKDAFPREFMTDLISDVHDYCTINEESFHKMLEGTPDFHRRITPELSKKYSIGSCKHSCYFYHWNEDPFSIFPAINARWRVLKSLMGLQYNEYEDNTPKDGVVDRIQVVRYPPQIGYLEPHVDAHQHQRLIFSGYMSKRGVHYQDGGFYLINGSDEVINIEDQIDVGDILFCYASVYHGVAPCDLDVEPDWTKKDGRWFLSMYSNASDELVDHQGNPFPPRATAAPTKLYIPEVLPHYEPKTTK